MRRRGALSRTSPFCSLPVLLLIILACTVVFRSVTVVQQSESEARLSAEIKALSEEFGLEFSVTLKELVKRGVVSPTLATSLLKSEGVPTTTIVLDNATEAKPVEDDEVELKEELEDDQATKFEKAERPKGVSDAAKFFEDAKQWMKPREKFFVYQSSGGLSNQRIMLEYALIIGRLLNRTILVPGMGPHTSMWYNFNKIPLEDFLAADELLDNKAMENVARTLILRGVTFKRFIAVNENKNWLRVERNKLGEKRLNPWSIDYMLNTFGSADEPVLFFARGTMWECFDFPQDLLDEARRAVRAHPDLRKVARDVSKHLFPRGFNAMHIRFMDNDGTDLREGLLKPAPTFIYRMRKFDKSIPLYVATVPSRRKSAYFNSFKSQFDLVFGDRLEQNAAVISALSGITRRMKETVLGVIEQLVCARAEKFLGTGFSTFSEHIRRMRRWRELVAVENLADSTETLTESKFLKMVTPCNNPLMPC